MELTKERKGEIADKLLAEFLKNESPKIVKPNEFRRKIGELSQKIGVPKKELTIYLKEKLTNLFTEMFA